MAGVRLEDTLADAVTAGNAGGALRAGLRAGQEAFVRHLAEQFIAHPEEPLHAYLSAALILVAEHQEHGIVGALIAYPPSNVALDHLRQARRKIISNRDLNQLAMAGAIGAAKVKAVATAAHARGAGIGSALIQCCSQVYFRCGYVMIYGQMPAVPRLGRLLPAQRIRCAGRRRRAGHVGRVRCALPHPHRLRRAILHPTGICSQSIKVDQPLHLRPAGAAAGPRTSPLRSG